MKYLFLPDGRCVMRIVNDHPEHLVKGLMDSWGAPTCVESEDMGGVLEVCYMNEAIRKRPINPTIMDGMWLRRVPKPANVFINNVRYQTNESDIELSFPYPNTYKIRVEAAPFLDATFEVTTT